MGELTAFTPPAPTRLDRAIGALAPTWGYDRYQARVQQALSEWWLRSGEALGSSLSRLRSDWSSTTKSGDTQIRYDRERVRNIARDLIMGNPYAQGLIQRKVDNIVGTGIMPQCGLEADTEDTEPVRKPIGWRPISETEAKQFQQGAEELFAEFAETCDVTGEQNFYELQEVIASALCGDAGEILVHLPEIKRPGHPVSFGIELIEIDRMATPPGKAMDRNIREGKEINPATGEVVGYWIRDVHPGDDFVTSFGKYARIPARTPSGRPRMLHLYRKSRPGQFLGISPFVSTLGVFEDLHRYWEAEIVAARVAACFAAFIKSPASRAQQQNAGATNTSGKREEKLEPGLIRYLLPGEDISFGNPNRPNSAFGAFTEILLRAIGVAHALPFELIALDFSKTNYSSARASLLEARRSFQKDQKFLVRRSGIPIWQEVMREGIGRGRLYAPGFAARQRAYLSSFWTPPSWGWVDPVKEETAARESIAGFLSTHADELATKGMDFEQTVKRIAREHRRLKELGLPSPWDPVAGPTTTSVITDEEKKDALTAA